MKMTLQDHVDAIQAAQEAISLALGQLEEANKALSFHAGGYPTHRITPVEAAKMIRGGKDPVTLDMRFHGYPVIGISQRGNGSIYIVNYCLPDETLTGNIVDGEKQSITIVVKEGSE
jgi:hypothetical protein